jgi:hypothetical protein
LSAEGFKLGLMPAALAGWFELLPPGRRTMIAQQKPPASAEQVQNNHG